MSKNETKIRKDDGAKKMFITRHFDGPVHKVWKAWTDRSVLDQWWAPHPWRAETKEQEFKVGGRWLYSMIGPDGDRQFCRADYKLIEDQKRFGFTDGFCDENGVITNDFPSMNWELNFVAAADGTDVNITISFASEADMKKVIDMGFETGFTAAHGNLDQILAG